MNSDILVSASLLGCDLSNLENEIKRAQDADIKVQIKE